MRILLILLSPLLFLSASLSEPFITVKGRVMLEGSSVAAGISVVVKETKTVTMTNSEGEFTISSETIPFTLVFTYVGHKSVEYKVTEKNKAGDILITLHPINSAMEEVVVVGYATAYKKDITGSVSSVRTESMRRSFHEAEPLVGKVAGLSIERAADKSVSTYTNHAIGSGILTAGELSDFKKWKLWSDYSQTEFKQWSLHWGLEFKNRYCVQVQNEEHKALVGRKVYLLNITTKDTVWSAITDNTGKAELWANLESNAKEKQSIYTIVCENEELKFPTVFENGLNRITLKRSCGTSDVVDIAFVVDATGSMSDEIKYLQEELQDIISKTTGKHKEVNLRLGSVFYRDHGDEYLTRHIDFQKDAGQLTNFIKNQSAGGGGDTPEAVEDALSVALDSLHWTDGSRARILFLVLDAPPHDAAKYKMHVLIKKAAIKGIRIVPIVCSGIDKSAEYLMRCLALATNGSYVFLTDDSGIGNPHIKPTTDEFKVELLNVLLQRLIGEMIYVHGCEGKQTESDPANNLVNSVVKLNVYPNPTRGKITVESSEKLEEVFVTDFAGKILMKVNVSGKAKKCEADLSNYPSGVYLIKYFGKEKGWGAEKVLLLH